MTIEELTNKVTELEEQVRLLTRVENVPFIENAKRRIAIPVLGESISKNTTGSTSGLTESVDEAGVSSYSVAAAYSGSITIADAQGNRYKLGYYTA